MLNESPEQTIARLRGLIAKLGGKDWKMSAESIAKVIAAEAAVLSRTLERAESPDLHKDVRYGLRVGAGERAHALAYLTQALLDE